MSATKLKMDITELSSIKDIIQFGNDEISIEVNGIIQTMTAMESNPYMKGCIQYSQEVKNRVSTACGSLNRVLESLISTLEEATLYTVETETDFQHRIETLASDDFVMDENVS